MKESSPHGVLPITEDDAFIAKALESASIPTLMMSMIHISGETGILEGATRPQPAMLGDTQGQLGEEEQAAIRAQAFEVLKKFRDEGCQLPPPPSRDTVLSMMRFAVGEEVPNAYVPMMLEEMDLEGSDSRAFKWKDEQAATKAKNFHVLVIGAGMSGLLAAIRLEQAGIRYSVIEKNAEVGGTWFENSYPGSRVDIANHFYCYSFEPNPEWSEFFARRDELHAYFQRCALKYDVLEKIRFETEVVSAQWDESGRSWSVALRDGAGGEEISEFSAIVSAVGQLNRPNIPSIEGLEQFQGHTFHSAEWRHDVDLTGKRVAVIGTGASALQLVPEVAMAASQLYVFQRSPAWMFPNPDYHAKVSEGKKWLLAHVPFYSRWYRFLLFWPGSDGLMPSLIIDPDWPHPERSVNQLNEETRIFFTEYMRSQVGDDEELLEKVVPRYPPFGKRMLQDNGSWLATLQRENVDLVASAAKRITPRGIIGDDGIEREVDIIVFATGFHAGRFLWPMRITGKGGGVLEDVWGDEPRAYLGIAVPDFPNLFCLYGPATNLAHAGSIIFSSECQVRYVLDCLATLIESDYAAMDCRRDIHEAFAEKLDAAFNRTVWAHPGVENWYKNARGSATTTSPWLLVDYWEWTRKCNPDDYELIPKRSG